MKKVVSFLAACSLVFGLLSCSGDMHNDIDPATIPASQALASAPKLGKGGVPGAMNGWNNQTAWTSADDTNCTYVYDFVATDTELEWKVISQTGDWNSGAWGGGSNEVINVPVGTKTQLSYDNKSGGNKNVKTSGLKKDKIYTLTLTYESGSYFALISESEKVKPVPVFLDGFFFFGRYKADDSGWDPTVNNLFRGATVDEQTGEVVYKLCVETTADCDEFVVASVDESDTNKFATTYTAEVKVGGDYVELTKDAGSNGKIVENKVALDPAKPDEKTTIKFEKNSKYNIFLKSTPDGKVYIKIDEVPQFLNIVGVAFVGLNSTKYVDGSRICFKGDYITWDDPWAGTNKQSVPIENGVAAYKLEKPYKLEKNKSGETQIHMLSVGCKKDGNQDADWSLRLGEKYNLDQGNGDKYIKPTDEELDGSSYIIFADCGGLNAGDKITYKLLKVDADADTMFIVGATKLPAFAEGEDTTLYLTGAFNGWAEPGKDNKTAAVKVVGGRCFSVGFCKKDTEIEFKFAAKAWTRPELCLADKSNLKATFGKKTSFVGTYEKKADHPEGGTIYVCKWELK